MFYVYTELFAEVVYSTLEYIFWIHLGRSQPIRLIPIALLRSSAYFPQDNSRLSSYTAHVVGQNNSETRVKNGHAVSIEKWQQFCVT